MFPAIRRLTCLGAVVLLAALTADSIAASRSAGRDSGPQISRGSAAAPRSFSRSSGRIARAFSFAARLCSKWLGRSIRFCSPVVAGYHAVSAFRRLLLTRWRWGECDFNPEAVRSSGFLRGSFRRE